MIKTLKTFVILILLLFNISAISQINPNPSTDIDNYILNEMSSDHLAGLSTIIVKGGEIVWVKSYGMADVANNIPVTDSTVFMLASVSKLFTGTAIMHLLDNNQISTLDDPINDYLPFPINVPGFANSPITIRHLMTHTSAIKDNDNALDKYYSNGDPKISLADCIHRYFHISGSDYNATRSFHSRAPDTGSDYTNIGIALLGYLVEVISGMPFDEYCDIHIFNPLCMKKTSWSLAALDINNIALPHRYTSGLHSSVTHYGFADYPNGLLRSNVLDLANYMLSFMQDGSFNNQNILTATSVGQMMTPQIPTIADDQGLVWYQESLFPTNSSDKIVWGHNGGEDGASADLYIHNGDQIGIALLSNSEGDLINIVDRLYGHAQTFTVTGIGNPVCSPSNDEGGNGNNYSDCSQSEMAITDQVISDLSLHTYITQDRITSNANLSGNSSFEFVAGQHITLQPNFEVALNVEFIAKIEDCAN